jgi:predicted amidohydrolase
VRAAAVQMCSTDDMAANLAAAESLVREAAVAGAELVALPENFAYLRREGLRIPCAQPLDGPIVAALREWARAHRIWLLGGSFAEAVPQDERVHNTSVLVGPDGSVAAVYRKIHLFDVDLAAQGGSSYRESAAVAPGSEVVVAETPFGGVGLSICYDVRFPELYRALAARGARFLLVPSAFARETGRDHWEVLRASPGRALIADPWGVLLGVAPDRPGVVVADCDLAQQDRVRASLPALQHRRL